MKNPYRVLGISPAANDTDIKEAYVQKVKEYSPDRFPEKFKEIRKAYEAISTPRDRVAYKLFFLGEELDPQYLVLNVLKIEHRNRISPKQLIESIIKKYEKSKAL